MHLTLRYACSIALSATVAALGASEPLLLSDRTISNIAPGGDPATVRAVRLFVSADGGANWALAEEKPVAAGATAVPAFTWVAPRDGTYQFLTPLRFHPGKGSDQADPVAGKTSTTVVTIDTTPPRLTPGAMSAQRLAGGATLAVAVAWTAEDAAFAATPVTVEISADGGRTFAISRNGPASGTLNAEIALAPGCERPLVRLTATDRLGQVAATPAMPIEVAKPADPVAALKQAVLSLPAPLMPAAGVTDEVAMANASTSPASATTAAPSTPEPMVPVATVKMPMQRPGPALEPEAVEVVGSSESQEQRYGRAIALNGSGGTAVTQHPQTTVARVRGLTPDAAQPFLTGATAVQALDRASAEVTAGRPDDALAIYLQLQRSDVAESAISSEFALLRSLSDWTTLAGRVDQLPAHLLTADACIDGAWAHVILGHSARAMALVSGVPKASPRAREGLLIMAKAAAQAGDNAKAAKIFTHLAKGDDAIAEQARSAVAK